jgi:hydroxyacid-oxoacid transhydrogenase
MKKAGLPNGLNAVGYAPEDVPALVEGTLPQHRVTKLAPIPAGPGELKDLFLGNMKHW